MEEYHVDIHTYHFRGQMLRTSVYFWSPSFEIQQNLCCLLHEMQLEGKYHVDINTYYSPGQMPCTIFQVYVFFVVTPLLYVFILLL